jgi:hypothetical protein
MMTSFAFIFGLFPLVVATGASQLARRDVGTPVFGEDTYERGEDHAVIPRSMLLFQLVARTAETIDATSRNRAQSCHNRAAPASQRGGLAEYQASDGVSL